MPQVHLFYVRNMVAVSSILSNGGGAVFVLWLESLDDHDVDGIIWLLGGHHIILFSAFNIIVDLLAEWGFMVDGMALFSLVNPHHLGSGAFQLFPFSC